MKTISIIALLCSVAAAGRCAEAQIHPPRGTNAVLLTPAIINQLVDEMRERHPALRAGEARLRAAALATNSVRTWEDPMFTFGGVVASSRGPMLEAEGDLVYGLEQKLPLFGKPKAARAVAQAGADVEEARLTNQLQTLRRDLTRALFRSAVAERVVELGREDLAWLEVMTVTAEERYRAGTASQVDVLRLQNERSRRVEQVRTDEQRSDQELVTLHRLLNREPSAPLPKFNLPPAAPAIPYSQPLVQHAVQFEPRLHTLRREIREAETSVAAIRKTRLPEVSAGIEGRQFSGDGGFREGMFSVSLSLPWLNHIRYRSDVAREQARLSAAELQVADYQLALREEIHLLTVGIDAARREALVYRDEILPRSQQALESARANWLANRSLFNDVMESRRMLLEAQLMSARAVAEQHQLMADLVLLGGFPDLGALQSFVETHASDSSQPAKP